MGVLMLRGGGGKKVVGGLRRGGEDEVVELSEFADLRSLIDAGDDGLAHSRVALSSSRSKSRRLADLELLAPLGQPPGNVIAIGRNYQKHAAGTAHIDGHEPSPPTVFTKAITSLTEPFADIVIDPSVSDKLDWEVELAILIGKAGANIKRERAREHVSGYTVLNDVTARDIQSTLGGQYFKGKSLDRSCPTGPWVVTKDEIENPQVLNLLLRVNGTVKQDGNTGDMIYPVDAIIEWVSKGITHLPVSIIASVTPVAVVIAITPPEILQPLSV